MSLFMLETDAVSSAASSLSSVTSELSSLSSSVSSYDTSCQDFDFSSAKSVIASNIEACGTKVSNTIALLNEVVNQHTALQNGLIFQTAAERAAAEQAAAEAAAAEQSTQQSGDYYADSYGSPSGGGSSSSGGGGGSSGAVGGTVGGATGLAGEIIGGTETTQQPETQVEQPTLEETTPPAETEPVEVKIEDPQFGETKVTDEDDLSPEEKEYFKDPFFNYNDSGYAMIDDTYVISCTSDVGKIGDKVVFTLEDGQKVECVIGEVRDDSNKEIRFFTNDKFNSENKNNITAIMEGKIVKIENYGNAKITVAGKVDSATDWAVQFSQTEESYKPTKDKISYIVHAYKDAGIPINVPESGYDGDIQNLLVKSGFNWVEGNPNISDLKKGDILLTENNGVMMYVESGKIVVDYTTFNTKKDENGNDVPDIDFDNLKITGVLRYSGKPLEQAKVIFDKANEEGVKA